MAWASEHSTLGVGSAAWRIICRRRGKVLASTPTSDLAVAKESLGAVVGGLARRRGVKGWKVREATSLARLWRDQGRVDEACDLLAPVYGWFTEGFDTPDLKEAKALLDELRE